MPTLVLHTSVLHNSILLHYLMELKTGTFFLKARSKEHMLESLSY